MEKIPQKLKHAANIPGFEGTGWKINLALHFPAMDTKGTTQTDATTAFKIYNFYANLYIQTV